VFEKGGQMNLCDRPSAQAGTSAESLVYTIPVKSLIILGNCDMVYFLMRSKNVEHERNQVKTTSTDFLESYNTMIPFGFPKATTALMKKFQASHPLLFKHGDSWSIDKHRKRLMDWLSTHHVA
jgi:hypothetical protein